MKKLSAILFSSIFLFNLYGYRLVFNYAQQQSDKTLNSSLDNNEFNEAELITVTVPLYVPYQNSQKDFERVDGELKLNGKIYKYVKRRIYDGQLILKCLPDHNKMRLESAKEDFFKYSNDLVQNGHSKKSDNNKVGVFKNLMGEYDHFSAALITPFFTAASLSFHEKYLRHITNTSLITPDQPPEVC